MPERGPSESARIMSDSARGPWLTESANSIEISAPITLPIFQVVGQSRDDMPTVVSGGKLSSRLALSGFVFTCCHAVRM